MHVSKNVGQGLTEKVGSINKYIAPYRVTDSTLLPSKNEMELEPIHAPYLS